MLIILCAMFLFKSYKYFHNHFLQVPIRYRILAIFLASVPLLTVARNSPTVVAENQVMFVIHEIRFLPDPLIRLHFALQYLSVWAVSMHISRDMKLDFSSFNCVDNFSVFPH